MTVATIARRWRRKRHHMSCHWLATEIRSSATSPTARSIRRDRFAGVGPGLAR